MTAQTKFHIRELSRLTLVLSSSLLLLFVLGRCSPISPSVSKAQLLGNNDDAPNPRSAPNVHVERVRIIAAKGHLIDEATYLDIAGEQAFVRQAPDISLGENQVADLKTSHRATFQMSPMIANESVVYFVTALPRALDSNALPMIELTLQRLLGNTWMMTLKPTGNADNDAVVDLAVSQLQNVIMTFPKKLVEELPLIPGNSSPDPAESDLEEF